MTAPRVDRSGEGCNVAAVLSDGRTLYRCRHGRQARIQLGYWYSFDQVAADAVEPYTPEENQAQFDARVIVGDGTPEEVFERLLDTFGATVH